MDRDQFLEIITNDPQLGDPIYQAGRAGQAARAGQTRQFNLPLPEAAVVVLMFPIVKFMLTNIGLPWLYEVKRYSELQRRKVHDWIDQKYREERIDPDAAEAASDALCEQLEQTTGAAAQAAWERLAALMKGGGEEE